MNVLENFKKELTSVCKIVQWDPTDEQLISIANYIIENQEEIGLVRGYICQVCDDVLVESFEGIDNSDLNCLLAIAIKTVQEV